MSITFTVLTGTKTTAGSLANWVNRSDLPTSIIVAEAEAMIYETLRVREMTAREALTFGASTQTAALPTGFLDPISYRPYEWGAPLPFVFEDALEEARDSAGTLQTGAPSKWTIIGETAYVDVLPSAAFSGILLYYKTPTALSGSNETNFLTNRYPSLLRYACMAKAYEHMQDGRAAEYIAAAMGAVASANTTNELWRRAQFFPS